MGCEIKKIGLVKLQALKIILIYELGFGVENLKDAKEYLESGNISFSAVLNMTKTAPDINDIISKINKAIIIFQMAKIAKKYGLN